MYVCVGVCIYASFFGNECNKFSSNQICMFVWDIFYWYINLRRICSRRMCIYCMMYDFARSLFVVQVRNEGAEVGRLMVERSRTGGEGVLNPDGFAREIAQLVGYE
jgi:hypothetical protein